VSSSSRTWWHQLVHWPVFCALGVIHIVVLPLVLSEHEDEVVSIVAGGVYLALAAADAWSRRPRGSPSSGQ
jgi:hypothetical protein